MPPNSSASLPAMQTVHTANAEMGAERNQQMTEVIYHVSDLDNTPSDWRISGVHLLATVDTASLSHSRWDPVAASQTSRCHPSHA